MFPIQYVIAVNYLFTREENRQFVTDRFGQFVEINKKIAPVIFRGCNIAGLDDVISHHERNRLWVHNGRVQQLLHRIWDIQLVCS